MKVDFWLVLWQLPQFLVALVWVKLWKLEYYGEYYGRSVYLNSGPNSCGLGEIAVISKNAVEKARNRPINTGLEGLIAHEALGHGTQSMLLGPLYLFTVGLMSALSLLDGASHFKNPVENWANRLAGVAVILTGNGSGCTYYLKKV